MMAGRWCLVLLVCSISAVYGNDCPVPYDDIPGPYCRTHCCDYSEELRIIAELTEKFPKRVTRDIRELLAHGYTDQVFYDLFYPDTPRYALLDEIVAAAKVGDFDNVELMDFEIVRKMRMNSFTTDACKQMEFMQKFVQETKTHFAKSHAIYRALKLGDEIKEYILNMAISETCIHNVFKSSLISRFSCSSCGKADYQFMTRTCTSLCENVINGCYYITTRVLGDEYENFISALQGALHARSDVERAYERKHVDVPVTQQDIEHGVECSGLPDYEVKYRLERLVKVPKVGREYYFSRAFKLLLRVPEHVLRTMLPIMPDATSVCRNQGHLSRNEECYNGVEVGSYPKESYPLTAAGQSENEYKNFGGTYEDYNKLTDLQGKMQEIRDDLLK